MARCKECESCAAIIEYRGKHKSKIDKKKVKKFETANPCSNPTAKRARISEAELLVAAGHGGEIRGEYLLLMAMDRR